MVNYSKSKIYEIRCNITNKIYYGSTTKKYLSSRLSEHRTQFKRWLKDNKSYCSSFEIIKNGDYKIILVENFECKSKDELRAREQHYINNNDCINKRKAFKTEKDKKDYIKARDKKYYEENKEIIKQRNKKYKKKNKDNIKEKRNKYYEEKKHIIKNYYQENKEHIENVRRERNERKKIFLSSFGYEKKVFSCNLLNIDLSIFE